MNKVLKVLKRITFSFAALYSFNILLSSFNLNIAVNPISLGVVSALGVPGMISLVIIKAIIK